MPEQHIPDPADRLYDTICSLWPQYVAQPRSDVTRVFVKKYPPAKISYRELLLLPCGVPDPLHLFDESK